MSRQRSTAKAGPNPKAGKRVTCSSDVRLEAPKQHSRTRTSQSSSSRSLGRPKTLKVFNHDLDEKIRDLLIQQDSIAIDTETDGLDPRKDALRIITICTSDKRVFIIRNPDWHSLYTQSLLADGFSTKIFHHAFFDLQFIKAGIGVDVRGPIECTKTLMKLSRPDLPSGLGNALKHILNVQISKGIDHKKWKLESLSARQKEYIANDTIYLHQLLKEIKRTARFGVLHRYGDIMNVIRLKASIELEGYIDVFTYQQAKFDDVQEKRKWWATKEFTNKEIFTKGGKSCLSQLPVL